MRVALCSCALVVLVGCEGEEAAAWSMGTAVVCRSQGQGRAQVLLACGGGPDGGL